MSKYDYDLGYVVPDRTLPIYNIPMKHDKFEAKIVVQGGNVVLHVDSAYSHDEATFTPDEIEALARWYYGNRR